MQFTNFGLAVNFFMPLSNSSRYKEQKSNTLCVSMFGEENQKTDRLKESLQRGDEA